MIDYFKNLKIGKAALKKIGTVPENFALYEAGWLGKNMNDIKRIGKMKVTGACFSDKDRIIQGTKVTVTINSDDIAEFDND